ncbi:hypothetical protein M427DRAFT_64311 [Gonapodya prolifera JEL478]|uniref:Protein-lysine N-methyltransferase EFM5 n=1 Tax=Gonapodya prolifera (strain JEL478) TaxID=1344416 RepID=A0A138ZXX6_GONPJ|nr:hypothetical protein M427DRAFT_64311 [Gonapodya prolifera JEL478]|eukprot:KXS09346.1 hypothetical protein M427DRAFT_64311 [Gonapodya prolifera JEL478]
MATRDSDSDSDTDAPALSPHALAALQSFVKEKQEQVTKFARLAAAAESKFQDVKDGSDRNADGMVDGTDGVRIEDFEEDWNMSQFWYDDDTAEAIAREAIAVAVQDKPLTDGSAKTPGRIGVLCAPSVFVKLQAIVRSSSSNAPSPSIHLFEHDPRFRILNSPSQSSFFHLYDYSTPCETQFASNLSLESSFDVLVVDPPFLSEECWTKVAQAVKWLGTRGDGKEGNGGVNVVACTGAVLTPLLSSLLDLRPTVFQPHHKGGRLSNEFSCFTNYRSGRAGFAWKDQA